jgi:hypothetical protein
MEELSHTQYKAITMLVAGYTFKEVASKTGVAVKTIERWRKLPTFKNLVQESQLKCFESAIAELVVESRKAAKELNLIIKDCDTPTRVKVSAISTLLTFASKIKDNKHNYEPISNDTNDEIINSEDANVNKLLNAMLHSGDENKVLKALEIKRRYMETESKLKDKVSISEDEFNNNLDDLSSIISRFVPTENVTELMYALAQLNNKSEE